MIDSLDMWPTLSKKGAVSPRTELFMDHTCLIQVRCSCWLISNDRPGRTIILLAR